MKLSDYSIKHPVIITIGLITAVVFSLIAYNNLSAQFLPDITQPQAFIITTYPGVSAKRVEKEVSKKVADALVTIPGIKDMTTDSRDSVSVVQLTFSESENVETLLPVIREKLNIIGDSLPKDISAAPEIHVSSVATYLPIMTFAIESDVDLLELTKYAEDTIVPSLFSVQDVSKVLVHGGKYNEVEIKLHLEKLNAKGISVLNIREIIGSSNVSIPSGTEFYQDSEVNIRTSGEFSSISEIENLIVGYKDGGAIYLKDLATISVVTTAPDVYITSNGQEVPFIEVFRREGGDVLGIIDGVKEKLQRMQEQTKGKLNFEIIKDDSKITEKSISSVIQSAIMGTILAILVILLFLHNFKATVIIGISIPLSILLTFIGFYFSGVTLNILSLSGMTVALGMLVDPSIVVLENIHNKLEAGLIPSEASSVGAGEVGGAVIASATTSICVFAPLLFLTGVVGIFMGGVAKTMIFALTASVMVALLVLPFLTSKLMKKSKHSGITGKLSDKIGSLISKLDIVYRKTLEGSLKHGKFIIFFVISIFIISLISLTTMGTSFIPSVDSGEFEIEMSYPDGFGLEKSLEKSRQIEQIVLETVPEITTSLIVTNKSSATGYFSLIDKKMRDRDVFKVIEVLQSTLTPKVIDAEIKVRNAGMDSVMALATGGQGFIIDVKGNNLDELEIAGNQIEHILSMDSAVISTEMSLNSNRKEIVSNLMLDKMGSLGITPYEAAITTRLLFNGDKIGTFSSGNEDMDIRILSDLHGNPITSETFETMTIVSRNGENVNFSTFSTMEVVPTLDNIKTTDRIYSLKVMGLLNTSETGAISSRMRESLSKIDFPIGIEWSIGGSAGLWSDSLASLLLVLGVAIFLVYVVMVIQFERFVQPLIIMASIPFCLIGVIFGLKIFGSNLSLISFLALISLGGIVVNNAIVLIDYINFLRKEKGYKLMDAIIEGGSSRIQPILMTTLTTMLGVIPMATGTGEGADMYAPLGQAIFGGLITSTLITLILIPVLYNFIEKRKENINEQKI